MRRFFMSMLLLVVAAAVPMFGQQQYCFGSSPEMCMFLEDSTFSQGSTYWTYDPGSGQATVNDPCGIGTNTVADLEAGDYVFQDVYGEDPQNQFAAWTIDFEISKPSAGSGYDYIEIAVLDLNAPSVETYRVYADEMSSNCEQYSIPLYYDYSETDIRVRFRKNSMASIDMYVDNVSLWGSSF